MNYRFYIQKMYSKNKQTFISIPKHNKDIESNINNKNDKHDYETIRNIVLEKNEKILNIIIIKQKIINLILYKNII